MAIDDSSETGVQPHPPSTEESSGGSRRWFAILGCAALALMSYALATSAVLSKSPTTDEPEHFAAAYTHRFLHDYRLDPEDPPLWTYPAMLPIRIQDLGKAASSAQARALWERSLSDPAAGWEWEDQVLFRNPGTDAPALINRSRLAMAISAPAMVLLACAVAWRLAGPMAALLAGALLALDPLLLGHAPLVKNDVAITLVTLALAAALVAVMRRASIARLIVLSLCGAVATVVKFSGPLLLLLACATLLVRALLAESWPVLGRDLRSRASRLLFVLGYSVLTLVLTWLVIWGAYGFRYAPATAGQLLPERWYVHQVRERSFLATHQRPPADQRELQSAPVGRLVPIALWMNAHHALPNAYCMGLIFTHALAQSRNCYLLGEVRTTGWWYYFPLAMLFKTPTASILFVLGSAVAAIFLVRSIRRRSVPVSDDAQRSRLRNAAVCLAVLGGGYMLVAMKSNLNIGVRHVMPVYPLLYIAASVVFAHSTRAAPRAAGWIAALIVIGLAVESLAAYPNYIAFFNAPSGGSRGGLRLLGDSNLDWGQDLPLLADWQARHPAVKLYLSYFGGVDPDAFGIDYVNIGGVGSNPSHRPAGHFSDPGVFAVSATHLQGIYLPPGAFEQYISLRNVRPREVLGGTIYLFDYPFPSPGSSAGRLRR
jgi:hypothetical protein